MDLKDSGNAIAVRVPIGIRKQNPDYILIDEIDLDLTNGRFGHSVYLRNGYPSVSRKGSQKYVHRLIAERMGLDMNGQVDHVNRNRLDLRRGNIRVVSKSENCRNIGVRKTSNSGFKGVAWDGSRGQWTAQITRNKRTHRLGRFNFAVEAAISYDNRAIELDGHDGYTNKALGLY